MSYQLNEESRNNELLLEQLTNEEILRRICETNLLQFPFF